MRYLVVVTRWKYLGDPLTNACNLTLVAKEKDTNDNE